MYVGWLNYCSWQGRAATYEAMVDVANLLGVKPPADPMIEMKKQMLEALDAAKAKRETK